MDIEAPGTNVWRSYSMAGTSESDDLEFLIRLAPHGFFSKFLLAGRLLACRVRLHGPSGAFAMRENGFRPRYFVRAARIVAVLSMIRHMQIEGHPQQAKLFFGVANECELFFAESYGDRKCDAKPKSSHICYRS